MKNKTNVENKCIMNHIYIDIKSTEQFYKKVY